MMSIKSIILEQISLLKEAYTITDEGLQFKTNIQNANFQNYNNSKENELDIKHFDRNHSKRKYPLITKICPVCSTSFEARLCLYLAWFVANNS